MLKSVNPFHFLLMCHPLESFIAHAFFEPFKVNELRVLVISTAIKLLSNFFSMPDEPKTIGSEVIKEATNLSNVPSQPLIFYFPDIFLNMGFIWLNRLIRCLARHHQQGIIQDDLHMGNFLLKDKNIYSLDGDHVHSFRSPITKSRSLTNLSKLLSNFFPLIETRILENYQVYCSARGWIPTEKGTRKLIRKATGMRKRRLAKNVRKMYRSGSSFSVFKTSGYYSIRNRGVWNDRFKIISDHPEPIIAQTRGEQMDGFNKYHLSIDDVPVTLYSARAFGFFWLRRFGVVSRLWRNALRLNRLEIHTPRPIAIIEKRKRPMIWHAFLIVESWKGVVAQSFFLSDSVPERDKHIVAERIANAFFVMQQTGIAIRGVCSTNIIISDLKPVFLNVLPFSLSFFSKPSGFIKSVHQFLEGWDHASEVRRLFHEKFKEVKLI